MLTAFTMLESFWWKLLTFIAVYNCCLYSSHATAFFSLKKFYFLFGMTGYMRVLQLSFNRIGMELKEEKRKGKQGSQG